EIALLLQVAHGIADGSRRYAQSELVSKTPRSGRLSRFDIRLDYGLEYPPFALIQTREGHCLKYSSHCRLRLNCCSQSSPLRCKVSGEAVEPQPTSCRQSDPAVADLIVDDCPARLDPALDDGNLIFRDRQT